MSEDSTKYVHFGACGCCGTCHPRAFTKIRGSWDCVKCSRPVTIIRVVQQITLYDVSRNIVERAKAGLRKLIPPPPYDNPYDQEKP